MAPSPEVTALIQLLNLIDSNDTIDINNKRDVHPLIEAVVYLATECFTVDDKYSDIEELKNAGYSLYPAERDRFGWLTGWIKLKRGKILFG